MKLKTVLVAVLAATSFATCAQAQNLFRTGRPEYARQGGTYHDRYQNRTAPVVNNVQSNWMPVNPLPQSGVVASRSYPNDQERLQIAWERYRGELARYQARYGGSATAPSDFSRQYPVRPVGYEEDLRGVTRENLQDGLRPRCQHRRGRPAAGQPETGGFLPADERPRLNIPEDYISPGYSPTYPTPDQSRSNYGPSTSPSYVPQSSSGFDYRPLSYDNGTDNWAPRRREAIEPRYQDLTRIASSTIRGWFDAVVSP